MSRIFTVAAVYDGRMVVVAAVPAARQTLAAEDNGRYKNQGAIPMARS
jgi:hypothetical protein